MVRRAQQLIEEGALKAKSGSANKSHVSWKLGDLEFEAYMRMMDSAVSDLHHGNLNFHYEHRLYCLYFIQGPSYGLPI